MQEHEGTIRVQSSAGVGTTVTLSFPAAVEKEEEHIL
jgi:signal transduction histidine kinase